MAWSLVEHREIFTFYFHFTPIYILFPKWCLPSCFSYQYYVRISHFSHAFYMSRLSIWVLCHHGIARHRQAADGGECDLTWTVNANEFKMKPGQRVIELLQFGD